MKEIEQLMKEVPASFVICDKSNVTKNMVLKEIMRGEKDASSIKKSLGICDDKECENRVEALLKIYLPIYDIIFVTNLLRRKNPRDDNVTTIINAIFI